METVLDRVVMGSEETKSLEDNSEGELDGESDVDDDEFETEGEIIERMDLD